VEQKGLAPAELVAADFFHPFVSCLLAVLVLHDDPSFQRRRRPRLSLASTHDLASALLSACLLACRSEKKSVWTTMFSRLLSVLAVGLVLLGLGNAHTVLTYPGWRGDNLVTNDTFPYGMQWMYPCEYFSRWCGGRGDERIGGVEAEVG
jgi:hypothetical protein